MMNPITYFKNLTNVARIQTLCKVSTIVIIILKLFNSIKFSWWIVFSPLLTFWLILILYLIYVFISASIEIKPNQKKSNKKNKYSNQNNILLFQNASFGETKVKVARRKKDASNKDKKEHSSQTNLNHAENP